MPLTFAEIQSGMSVSATSKLRPEDVKRGIVKYKTQQPFTPIAGTEVEDWVGIQIPGMDSIQNFSLKYWTLEASGAGAAAGGGGAASGGAASGGARRRRSSRRRQSKRNQRYTKKK